MDNLKYVASELNVQINWKFKLSQQSWIWNDLIISFPKSFQTTRKSIIRVQIN